MAGRGDGKKDWWNEAVARHGPDSTPGFPRCAQGFRVLEGTQDYACLSLGTGISVEYPLFYTKCLKDGCSPLRTKILNRVLNKMLVTLCGCSRARWDHL